LITRPACTMLDQVQDNPPRHTTTLRAHPEPPCPLHQWGIIAAMLSIPLRFLPCWSCAIMAMQNRQDLDTRGLRRVRLEGSQRAAGRGTELPCATCWRGS
jgi:hypothetical protein